MIKILLQSLKIHSKKFVLLVIQFSLAFFSLLISFSFVQMIHDYRNRVENIMDINVLQVYVDDTEGIPEELEGKNGEVIEIEELEEKINYENEVNINDKYKMGILRRIYLFEDDNVSINNVVMVNNDMLEMMEKKNSFNKLDELKEYNHNSEWIPVIVGSGCADQYKEGNVYNYTYINDKGCEIELKLKVVEVASADANMFMGNSTSICDTVNIKRDFIMLPQFTNFSQESYEYNVLIENNEEAIENITNDYLELNKVIIVHSLKEQIEKYYKANKAIVISTFIFAMIIMFLAILGCVGTMMSNIAVRKKEFGIYYALGLPKRSLSIEIFYEGMFVFVTSFIVSIAMYIGVMNCLLEDDYVKLNLISIFAVMVIMFACLLVCEVLPLKVINKSNLIELINDVRR